jgi:biopolymer transport protein ExbD
MGMNVGASSSKDAEPVMDINTTPLIDVMLVLIIMLIITIPPQMHSVNLDMPVSVPPTDNKPLELRIDIMPNNDILVNNVLTTRESLEKLFDDEGKKETVQQPSLLIRPDKTAKYEAFSYVMANAQRRNMKKLAVIGSEQFVKR